MTSPDSSAPGTGHDVARPPGYVRDPNSSTSKPALPSAADAASPASPAPRITTLGEGLIVSPGGMAQGSLGPRHNVLARCVVRDCCLQCKEHAGGIPGLATFAERSEAGLDIRLVDSICGEYPYFFLGRRHSAFFQMAHFFVMLFARPGAGELDPDVFVRPQSRKQDQIARQIDDPDRIAHIENEYLAAASHGGSLQDKLAGFGDRHEEALHFGVRHRDRSAREDLLFESRHHADDAYEHVTEP